MASLSSLSPTTSFQLEPHLHKLPSSAHLPPQKTSYVQRNLVSTTHSDGASELRMTTREAVSLVRQGATVEPQFYYPLLQHCADEKSASEARILHAHMIKTQAYEQTFLSIALVNAYAKCGEMGNARKVFDHLPMRSDTAWSILMRGYVQNSKPKVAVEVFQELLESGSVPSDFNLAIALSACYALKNSLDLGCQVHAIVIKYGMEHDTSIGNALCTLYSKSGDLSSAIEAFLGIEHKDVISWTSVITACDNNDDSVTGLRFFAEMREEDVEPNEYTFSAVLSMCSVLLDLDMGAQAHSQIVKLGCQSKLNIVNLIMNLYRKCGWIDEAQILFNTLESVNLATWNAAITGYAEAVDLAKDELLAHRSGTEALKNYVNLSRSGLKPDHYTMSSIFTVCGKLLASEQGEQIHAQTIKSGFLSNVIVSTALVTMYTKCGSIEEASKAFLEMSTRTMVSWTTMISSFAHLGRPKLALQLFEDMRVAGVKPNIITFMGVLAACSHAGRVEDALSYFQMMRKEYKIKPLVHHHGCLVDLYARLGRLDEAFNLIKKMEFSPNDFIYMLLISGCKNQGNEEMGFQAAQQLGKMKPKDPQICSFLLDMYISAESWEDVSRLEEWMKEEKIARVEDWSWISIKGKVQSFKTGFKSSPESIRLLEELLIKAKSHGYESQQALQNTGSSASAGHHSEKLAVSFGLLSTQTGYPVRVMKNTRMCRDCHNFIKIVSLMSNREVIVKDKWRIHKFVNGQCSCCEFPGLL